MKYDYKESGLDFIGKIPSHWTLSKIKNKCSVIPSSVDKKTKEDEIDVKLCNYVDVYYNDKITSAIDFMPATATAKEIDKYTLHLNDVIITKDSEDPDDIGIPSLVKEVSENLVCGYHLTIIRTNNIDVLGDYIFWCLKDPILATQLNKEATGVTRWAIASRHIKNVILPIPPFEEQKEICKYLDEASDRINQIIKLKFGSSKLQNNDDSRSQMKILLEYRKSLIHECVTGKKQIKSDTINKTSTEPLQV